MSCSPTRPYFHSVRDPQRTSRGIFWPVIVLCLDGWKVTLGPEIVPKLLRMPASEPAIVLGGRANCGLQMLSSSVGCCALPIRWGCGRIAASVMAGLVRLTASHQSAVVLHRRPRTYGYPVKPENGVTARASKSPVHMGSSLRSARTVELLCWTPPPSFVKGCTTGTAGRVGGAPKRTPRFRSLRSR